MLRVQSFASILAGEAVCGLVFDQDAVAAALEANFDLYDPYIPNALVAGAKSARAYIETMSENELVAFCRATAASAEHLQLISTQ